VILATVPSGKAMSEILGGLAVNEKYRTINIVPIIPSGAPKPIISTIPISTNIWMLQLLLIKFKF
jgi:hypothetical protein